MSRDVYIYRPPGQNAPQGQMTWPDAGAQPPSTEVSTKAAVVMGTVAVLSLVTAANWVATAVSETASSVMSATSDNLFSVKGTAGRGRACDNEPDHLMIRLIGGARYCMNVAQISPASAAQTPSPTAPSHKPLPSRSPSVSANPTQSPMSVLN